MSLGYYRLLPDHTAVPCEPEEVDYSMESRRVARTEDGEIMVSTVFLGIDHSWEGEPPMLFETMVFGGPFDQDQWQWRYSTWEEAEAGHRAAVQAVTEAVLDANRRPGQPLPEKESPQY